MSPQLMAAWAAAIGPEPAPFVDPFADEEQTELARVDALWSRKFGPADTWEPRVYRAYLTTIQTIHDQFPKQVA